MEDLQLQITPKIWCENLHFPHVFLLKPKVLPFNIVANRHRHISELDRYTHGRRSGRTQDRIYRYRPYLTLYPGGENALSE